jgi:hypothetical protein
MAAIAFRLRVLGWLFTIGIAASGLAGAERNPLLPHPQQIAYGSGAVSVRGLQIAEMVLAICRTAIYLLPD